MTNQTTPTAHLQSLIDQFAASSEGTKQAVKNDLLAYYYQLPHADRQTVRLAMQPFIDEIEQEMLTSDPLAQQAHALISQLSQRTVLS